MVVLPRAQSPFRFLTRSDLIDFIVLIEKMSTTHFADCLRVIVSRLSTEFPFDGSDHIYTIGVKHVLSSMMCAAISPFASSVRQKSFFHLRT
jgi:hypothetical protein